MSKNTSYLETTTGTVVGIFCAISIIGLAAVLGIMSAHDSRQRKDENNLNIFPQYVKEVTVTIPEQISQNKIAVPGSKVVHEVTDQYSCWETSAEFSRQISTKYSDIGEFSYKQRRNMDPFPVHIDFLVECKITETIQK